MPVEWHEQVTSTQDLAHQAAAQGVAHGTGFAAREQTRGRGTRGRSWISGRGGLWLSVVCRPPSPAPVEWLSLRVGLALADRLEQDTGLAAGAVQIKWPNDLYVADRKLAGILSEARWQGEMLSWVVVGVGVNVSNPLPAEASPAPIRLADLGTPPPLPELANRVAATIAEQTGRADRLDEGELARFAARDWLRGRVLAGPVPGIADGIAADGRLKVQDAAGNSTLVAGGIELA